MCHFSLMKSWCLLLTWGNYYFSGEAWQILNQGIIQEIKRFWYWNVYTYIPSFWNKHHNSQNQEWNCKYETGGICVRGYVELPKSVLCWAKFTSFLWSCSLNMLCISWGCQHPKQSNINEINIPTMKIIFVLVLIEKSRKIGRGGGWGIPGMLIITLHKPTVVNELNKNN